MTGLPSSERVAGQGVWVLPGVTALLAGSFTVLWLAWHRLAPHTAPLAPAFILACLVVALAEFSLAATFALNPARPPDLWRPLVAAGLLLFGMALGLTGHSRFFVTGGIAVLILALSARGGETLGAHLAPAVRMPADYQGGDWGRQGPETRRIVLETWVVSALAATRVGGWLSTLALAVMIAGGLVVVAGAKLDAAQRVSAEGGFSWNWMDRARAWRGVASLTAVLLVVAVAVPGLPPLISHRFARLPQRLMDFIFAPTGARPTAAPSTKAPPVRPTSGVVGGTAPARPAHAGGAGAAHAHWLVRLLQAALHAINALFGLPFVREGLPIVLTLGLITLVVVMVVGYWRNRPAAGVDAGTLWQRLWEAFRQFFAFWEWLRGLGGLGEERIRPVSEAAARREGRAAGGVVAGAAAAMTGLMDPRRIVRASYRRFLRTAAHAGQARSVAETPAEYARRLEAFLGADADPAQALTRAYEEARYSDHAVGAPLAAQARGALARLLRRLGGLSARLFGGPEA